MGPKTEKQAIDSVKLDNGEISYEHETILSKWKDDFSKLFKDKTQPNEVYDTFLENTRKLLKDWEDQMETMNTDINDYFTQIQNADQTDFSLNAEISMEKLRP